MFQKFIYGTLKLKKREINSYERECWSETGTMEKEVGSC